MQNFKLSKWHAVLILVLALVIVFPFPELWTGKMASEPADTYFFSWLMAHHWRQWSGTGFASYFDTGIYAPFPRTLLFSEFFVFPSLLGWPIHLLGGNSLAAFHFVNVLGTAATLLAMFWFSRRVFKNELAALFTALIFGFSAYQTSHLTGHLQISFGFCFPLAFWFTLEWLESGRRKWLVALAACWILIFYSNVYYFAFLSYAMPMWTLYLGMHLAKEKSREEARKFWWRSSLEMLAVLTLVGVCVGPIAIRYLQLKHEFPNIAFEEAAKQELQLDFGSLVRSTPSMLLAKKKKISENVAYPGIGILVLFLSYFTMQFGGWLKAQKRRAFLRPGMEGAWVLGLGFVVLGFSFMSLASPVPILKQFMSLLLTFVILHVALYLAVVKRNEPDPYHSRFFLCFALFWFFVGLGTNYFGGWQPFHWFLNFAPVLNGLRAIGRAYVLSAIGFAFFAGYILMYLQERLRSQTDEYSKLIQFALVTSLILGPAELLWGAHKQVGSLRHDPKAVLAASKVPELVEFYRHLSERYPEALIYEVPTLEWIDQLRIYQFGSALRDTLVRFQGLTGFTPEISYRSTQWLNDFDKGLVQDWPLTEKLILQLPVRLFVVHLDSPGKVDPRVLQLFKTSPHFRLLETLKNVTGSDRVLVYEKLNDSLESFGLVAHPVLANGLRDFLSLRVAPPENGSVVIPCGKENCSVSLFWPYSKLAPQSRTLTFEWASLPRELEVAMGLEVLKKKSESDHSVSFVLTETAIQESRINIRFVSNPTQAASLHAVYLQNALIKGGQ